MARGGDARLGPSSGEGWKMDGSSFDFDAVQFELDQQRRRKAEAVAERVEATPIRIPAAAWIPLFLWLTSMATAMVYFAGA